MRQRSDMKPSISLMPRSVYWPLRHMSHSPTAQFGHGTGIGPADDADHEITRLEPAVRPRIHHAAERFVAQHEAPLAARRPTVLAFRDLGVGAADADGDGFDQHRPVARVGLRHLIQPDAARALRLHRDRFQTGAFSPCTCSLTRRAWSLSLVSFSTSSAVTRPKRSSRVAARPVQPVW